MAYRKQPIPEAPETTEESVACPILAAKAALIMCESPKITEPQLYAALKAAAVDLGAKGFDPYTGWGHTAPKPKAKKRR